MWRIFGITRDYGAGWSLSASNRRRTRDRPAAFLAEGQAKFRGRPEHSTVTLESEHRPQLAIGRMSARDAFCFGLLTLTLGACTCLTEPGAGAPPLQEQPQAVAPAPTPTPTPAPAPPPAPAAPSNDEANPLIGASHILIAYKGSRGAAPTITRSKDDAQKLANSVRAQAKAGADFGNLALKYSDDPSAKLGKGTLGKFSRNQMVKPFADAAFALKPGEISGIVETPFGFHVIKRTE
jgi:hypothetical protein